MISPVTAHERSEARKTKLRRPHPGKVIAAQRRVFPHNGKNILEARNSGRRVSVLMGPGAERVADANAPGAKVKGKVP